MHTSASAYSARSISSCDSQNGLRPGDVNKVLYKGEKLGQKKEEREGEHSEAIPLNG